MRLLQSCFLLLAAGPAALCRSLKMQRSLHGRNAQPDHLPTYLSAHSILSTQGLIQKSAKPAKRILTRELQLKTRDPSLSDASNVSMPVKGQVLEGRSRQYLEASHQDSRRTSHRTAIQTLVPRNLDQSNIPSTKNAASRSLMRRGSCFGSARPKRSTRHPSLLDPASIYANSPVARTPAESFIAPSPFGAFPIQYPELTPPNQATMTGSSASTSRQSPSAIRGDSSRVSSPKSSITTGSQDRKSSMSTSSGNQDSSAGSSDSHSSSSTYEAVPSGSTRRRSPNRVSPPGTPPIPSPFSSTPRALDPNNPSSQSPTSSPKRQIASPTYTAPSPPSRDRAAQIAAFLGNKSMSEYQRHRAATLKSSDRGIERSTSDTLSDASRNKDPITRRKSSPPPDTRSLRQLAKESSQARTVAEKSNPVAVGASSNTSNILSPSPSLNHGLTVSSARNQGSQSDTSPTVASQSRRRTKQVTPATMGPPPLPRSQSVPQAMASLPTGRPPLTTPGRARKMKQ